MSQCFPRPLDRSAKWIKQHRCWAKDKQVGLACGKTNYAIISHRDELLLLYILMFGVWDELLYILMFGMTAGQVDVLNARSNFMNKYPEAARYITTRREMEAFFFKTCYSIVFAILSQHIITPLLFAAGKAIALLLAHNPNVAIANTSQSLRQMPFATNTKAALPCLTYKPQSPWT